MNVSAPAFDRSLLVQQKKKPKKIIFSQFQSSTTKRIVLATAVNNIKLNVDGWFLLSKHCRLGQM